jgi:hypothetical protein
MQNRSLPWENPRALCFSCLLLAVPGGYVLLPVQLAIELTPLGINATSILSSPSPFVVLLDAL